MTSKIAEDGGPIYNNKQLRIVMVGKTGVGKSFSGNMILGKKKDGGWYFESRFSFNSLTTTCSKASAKVEGQNVAVIDTPGLFDTRYDEKETKNHIGQCIYNAAPGPHIFLINIKLGRFTDEEKNTVQKIQQIFGEAANKYSMVLFTHGDLLKGEPIEEFLKESKDLQQLVAKCNGQYHVFNGNLKDRSQVRELLNKIRQIIEKNGGSHYTNEMFQEAERKIKEEQERVMKEKKEELRKQREKIMKEAEAKYAAEMAQFKDDIEKLKALQDARDKDRDAELNRMENLMKYQARVMAESKPAPACNIL